MSVLGNKRLNMQQGVHIFGELRLGFGDGVIAINSMALIVEIFGCCLLLWKE